VSLSPEQTLATAQQAAAPSTAPPAKGDRDPWFDNAKVLLVTLVVVGHSWTLLPQGTAVQLGYDWLYLWHMPAFVMVTGYLSRRFTYSWRNMRRLVTTVVVPYLLFEGLFAAFRVYVGGETLERLWLNPHWPLWYLVALFFWRLATPFFRRTALPLTLAVGVSLVGGIAGIETLDLSRTTGMLPFFVSGLLAQDHHLARLRSRSTRRLALGVLAVGALLTPWVEWGISTEWAYYRTSYAVLHEDWLTGMVIRSAVLFIGFAMALAVLSWVPRSRRWFTRLGAGSLVVYLFHGFFVKAASYAGYDDWADQHALAAFLLTTATAVLVALTLSWRPVRSRLQKVVTPVS
jgi:fucose 4-O-acetylase-like acetyltransferase